MSTRPWKCSTCGKRFRTEHGCEQHIADHHPSKGGSAMHEPKQDADDLREWEVVHILNGWPT